MRRLYLLLASAVIATTLIVVATGAAPQHPGPSPQPGAGNNQEFLALAIAPSLLKIPPSTATPNKFYPQAAEGYGTTLVQAKKLARASCEDNGLTKDQYYKNDCQGAVWVQNGWLALAAEQPPKGTTVPRGYQYAYGGAYSTTRNKAIGKALANCQDKDPKYDECVLLDAGSTDQPLDLNNHDGGSW